MPYKLLEGIRIIDLTMVFAGPVCSKILAEMGAEVIKIESIARTDTFTRANVYPDNVPGEDNWNQGAYFHTLNAGKYGISLNLGDERGKEIFKNLVRISDVVVENYSPRVMDNWGLGYEVLKTIKSDIIMVSMSGLGHYGPLRDSYMYVPGMEGMSGLTHITGQPDEAPLLTGHAYGDWVTGVNAAAAMMIALFYHRKTGNGQYIDLSGREAVACHVGETIMEYTLNKRDPMRNGNRDAVMAPHGCYRCKGEDSWLNIAVENEEHWLSLCQAAHHPDWMADVRFHNAISRKQNENALDEIIENWTSQFDQIELMNLLQKSGVPCGSVLDMKRINLDPHLHDRKYFYLIDHGPGTGQRPIGSQMPAKFKGPEAFIPKRAPRFAEDDKYVFGTLLKMSADEMALLAKDKIIGGPPVFPKGRPTRTDLINQQESGWFDPDYKEQVKKRYEKD
jgi:crotonobetainyl-CoA:carnitine CoA-transferase CaiB-like acyl-CoA transferase